MEKIQYKYKVKVGQVWVTGFSIGNDCPFPAIVLAGRERIATEFLTKETANEVADLVHGEVISIKYKVTQEIKRKWVGV